MSERISRENLAHEEELMNASGCSDIEDTKFCTICERDSDGILCPKCKASLETESQQMWGDRMHKQAERMHAELRSAGVIR